MSFDRRSFFRRTLGVATAAAAAIASGLDVSDIDVERILWTPTKTIFIPDKLAIKNVKIVEEITGADYAAATRGDFAVVIKQVRDGGRTVVTAIGQCEFDPFMNLLSVNGQPITSARVAAQYEATCYQRYGRMSLKPHEFEQLVERKVASRLQAGIVDQVRRDDLDFSSRFVSREPTFDERAKSSYRRAQNVGKHRRT